MLVEKACHCTHPIKKLFKRGYHTVVLKIIPIIGNIIPFAILQLRLRYFTEQSLGLSKHSGKAYYCLENMLLCLYISI